MNETIHQEKCNTIPYIGLASGMGGRLSGSENGPLVIQAEYPECKWEAMLSADAFIENRVEHIALLNQRLAEATFKAAKENPSVVVIGGDHSCAMGTWSGVAEARREKGEQTALLWFDAHMDSHTLETSDSGHPHGMPLAALLGYGDSRFTEILSKEQKIKPENLFLIGIRSYEAPEKELLEKLNVRIYYIEEVQQRGLKAIISEILEVLVARKIPYGISLDIDFFSPDTMPATGTPENPGAEPEEFIDSCSLFTEHPPIAFEFVEFNPSLDRDGLSLRYIKKIFDALIPLLP